MSDEPQMKRGHAAWKEQEATSRRNAETRRRGRAEREFARARVRYANWPTRGGRPSSCGSSTCRWRAGKGIFGEDAMQALLEDGPMQGKRVEMEPRRGATTEDDRRLG